MSELALELHVPEGPFSPFDPADWTQRGANLCAWEEGLRTPQAEREIAIDPVTGRVVVAVRSAAQADAVREQLRVVFAYGAVGPVGAHPIDRAAAPAATVTVGPGTSLADALGDLQSAGQDVVVRIADDQVHTLDLAGVAGTVGEGGSTLRLARSLTIRAADGAGRSCGWRGRCGRARSTPSAPTCSRWRSRACASRPARRWARPTR